MGGWVEEGREGEGWSGADLGGGPFFLSGQRGMLAEEDYGGVFFPGVREIGSVSGICETL